MMSVLIAQLFNFWVVMLALSVFQFYGTKKGSYRIYTRNWGKSG
jgi:hypothetical protein